MFRWVDIKRRQHKHHIRWEYAAIVHKMLWVSIHNNTHMHIGVTSRCLYQDKGLIGNKAAMLFHLKQFYTKKNFFTVFRRVDIKRRQHKHHMSWEYEAIAHKMLWVSIHNNTHMRIGVTSSCLYQDKALIGNKDAPRDKVGSLGDNGIKLLFLRHWCPNKIS